MGVRSKALGGSVGTIHEIVQAKEKKKEEMRSQLCPGAFLISSRVDVPCGEINLSLPPFCLGSAGEIG